jgi:hypothetical protein
MKKVLLLLLFLGLCSACEDVVEVDLEEAESRLIVDAILQWEKGTDGTSQTIKLSRTRGFFDQEPIPVSEAIIKVTKASGEEFVFDETNPGAYITNSFIPELEETYNLRIELDGEVYLAEEVLKPVVEIDSIEQNNEGGFSGEDIELKAFYNDPQGIDNYYLFKYFTPFLAFPEFDTFDDEFNDGNRIFGLFADEDLESDMDITIQLHGISESYFNFLEILLAQAGSAGGPFETQPATVRGNIKNINDDDELIFGYFGLSEVDEVIYTVE